MARDGNGRPTTAAVLSLDVRRLARSGLFAGGIRSGLWRWTMDGEPWGAAGYTATPEALDLRYASSDQWTGERREHAPRVELEWTPCPYGGRRPWFRCPRCGRRCAVIYLRRATACRVCHRLAYRSQREDASSRAARRGRKFMERLGLRGEDAHWAALEPWRVPKPPRMRWATYERVVQAAARAEDARVAALIPGMHRLLERLGR